MLPWLIENHPFGIYVLDAQLRFMHASKDARRAFAGNSPLIGSDFRETVRRIWPEPFASNVLATFARTLATGESYVAPVTVERRLDLDEEQAYDWRVDRIELPEGGHGLVCSFYDLSERQRLEARLEQADRHKEQFLATLSHELRNPLPPIRASAELLNSGDLKGEHVVHACQVIARQVRHMARLLDDLLDAARIGQDKLALQMERGAVGPIFEEAIEAVRPLIDSRQHRLEVRLPPAGVWVETDPVRLSQVISNLLANVAKYTEPGGRIELEAAADDRWLELVVRDTGIGIPADALAQIFDMYSQVQRPRGGADGGLGIGLALVKGLVTLQVGSIGVASEGLGRGSSFTVRLPIVVAADAAAGASGPQSAVPQTLARRRILIADDNCDAADMLGMLLEEDGHEVRVAHSGAAALEAAREFHPDVGLLDIGMPGMDGYELARHLRQEPWSASLSLIALTGWGQASDRLQALKSGFDAHLTKPMDVDALRTMLTTGEIAAPGDVNEAVQAATKQKKAALADGANPAS